MRYRFSSFFRLAVFSFVTVLFALSAIAAGTQVRIFTPIGNIDLELYDTDKPLTVQNFLKYVTEGRYDGTFVHRLESGFVIQGGGYGLTSGYQIGHIATYPAIQNEYAVGTTYSNTYGTIAMAKSDGDPNSATAEWFINLGNNSANLDIQNGGFTVFGHVIAGLDVLTRLNTTFSDGDLATDALGSVSGFSNTLPIAGVTNGSFYAEDLFFIAASVLDGSTPSTSPLVALWPNRPQSLPTPIPTPTSPSTPAAVSPAITITGGLKIITKQSSAKIAGTASSSVVRLEWRMGTKGKLHKQAVGTAWKLRVTGLARGANLLYARGVASSGASSAFQKVKIIRK